MNDSPITQADLDALRIDPSKPIRIERVYPPRGKRTARVVRTDRGGRQLRLYAGGCIYRKLATMTPADIEAARVWVAGGFA